MTERAWAAGRPERNIPTSFYFLPLRCEFCGRDNSEDDDRCDCPELEEFDHVPFETAGTIKVRFRPPLEEESES